MLRNCFFLVACSAIAFACLAGCGGVPSSNGNPAVPTTNPGASLAGNWLLYGALPTVSGPGGSGQYLAMTFDVSGSSVSATATMWTSCNGSGIPFGLIFGAPLKGTVASDGSFSLSETSSSTFPVFAVEGTVPANAAGSWSGSYTLSGSVGTCVLTGSGSFTAASINDLSGTFSGAGGGFMTSTALNMTVVLQQGAPLYPSPSPTTSVKYGLGGSLQINGFSCFTKGVMSTTRNSEIEGSDVTANYTMDDGSNLTVQGSLTTTQATQLTVTSLRISGGQCAGFYVYHGTPLILQR